MSYQPVIPAAGYLGWTYLKRTLERQQALAQSSPTNRRDEVYFREKIVKITSADDLVSDRRLLRIALTAFGLEADTNAKAFIRKVLSDGVSDPTALANRLADKRYRNLAETFGLGKGQHNLTQSNGFADALLNGYRQRSFEASIGEQNGAMRLALNAERELTALAKVAASEDAKWFTLMGNKPLRAVIETAFGLPASFGRLDIDQQLKTLKSMAQKTYGSSSVSQFSDPKTMDKLVRTYLVRDQLAAGQIGTSPAQVALQLLSR